MRYPFHIFLCLIVFAASVAHARKDKGEHLKFGMGKENEWKLINSKGAGRGKDYIMEFVREGDDAENPKERVVMHDFGKSGRTRSPETRVEEIKAAREKECPGGTEWKVIDSQKDSILFEWHTQPCPGQTERWEIARVLYGEHNVFLLRYTAKRQEPSPETRAEWARRFSNAAIDNEP